MKKIPKTKLLAENLIHNKITFNDVLFLLLNKNKTINKIEYNHVTFYYIIYIDSKQFLFTESSYANFEDTELCEFLYNLYSTDKVLEITDRTVGHLREQISRVHRQLELIEKYDDINRIQTAKDVCTDIDVILKDI